MNSDEKRVKHLFTKVLIEKKESFEKDTKKIKMQSIFTKILAVVMLVFTTAAAAGFITFASMFLIPVSIIATVTFIATGALMLGVGIKYAKDLWCPTNPLKDKDYIEYKDEVATKMLQILYVKQEMFLKEEEQSRPEFWKQVDINKIQCNSDVKDFVEIYNKVKNL